MERGGNRTSLHEDDVVMPVPSGTEELLCQHCLLAPIAAAIPERVFYEDLVVQLAGLTTIQELSLA